MTPLFSLMLLLTASVMLIAVLHRLRLPSILAYLALGAALGPHGLELVANSHTVESIAEFGVVFLRFSIGLEFSLKRLKAMRTLVFGYGAAQMLITAGATTLATTWLFGQSWRSGLAVGLAVAMSSTAIVARMLSERFELHSRSGQQTMGVLLFQDLAVVPCLILLPALAARDEHLGQALTWGLLQAAGILTLLIWLGQRLMRRIYDRIASLRSGELFVLTTLWIVISLAWLTNEAGLSLALGAFVGGMLISETTYRHQVEADVRPFRDVLLGLFFITIGMMLDLSFIPAHGGQLLFAVALLVGGKALVVLLVTLAARNPLAVALRTTGQLAQAGEFGLVLIELAHSLKLINAGVFQLTLAAMLISMFLAPGLIAHVARLSGRMMRGDWSHRAKAISDIAAGSMALENHVIICGYGRTGQQVGNFLAAEGIPFLALDIDPHRVQKFVTQGHTVVFGNADRSEVLQAAGLLRARAVVITYADTPSAIRITHQVRATHPGLPVIVRAPDEKDVLRLKQAGATEVIPEVLEGSLMIAAETLSQLGVPMERALSQARTIRATRYASMRDFYRQTAARLHGRGKNTPE